MERKVSISVILFLSLLGLFLTFAIIRQPPVPNSLLLNEVSYCQKVNQANAFQLRKGFEEVVANMRFSSSPGIRQAIDDAGKVMALWEHSDSKMEMALASSALPDSVKAHLTSVQSDLAITREMYIKETGEKMSSVDELDKIHELPVELVGLSLARARVDVTEVYRWIVESFLQKADAANMKFDSWLGMLEKSGKENGWVKGQIAFNAPIAMHLNKSERIQIRISKKFIASMTESMGHAETVTTDSLLVGDIMMVKLFGEDFKVTGFDDEEQGVTEDGYSQWEFDVTPLHSGNHQLFLKVGMVYYITNLGPTKKYFPVYEKKIVVNVGAWQAVAGFAVDRWEFLLSTIVIPIGVWGVSRLRRRS